jgi:DNA-binding transcriptional LysR family regulator
MEQERWFGVELKHLTALVAVAHEGSFRGAADSLGYVQSAISQQVGNLEKIVGARLVERFRGSKEIRLTPEGELLVRHGQEILARVQAARFELESRAGGGAGGPIRVAVSQSVAVGLLPDVIRRLAVSAPDLKVVPVEAGDEDGLPALVDRSRVDLALGDLPPGSGPFDSATVMLDPCALLVSASSGLGADGTEPTLEEIAALPLIGLGGWRFTSILEAWFSANGLTLDIVLTADSAATARGYVAAGLGAAIVPRLGVDTFDPRVRLVDLGEVLPSRSVAVFWNPAGARRADYEAFRAAAMAAAGGLRRDRQTLRPVRAAHGDAAA